MTEDEILAEAARINRRRHLEAKLAGFEQGRDVMVRWSNPAGSPDKEGYASIPVTKEAVDAIVRQHFTALIAGVTKAAGDKA